MGAWRNGRRTALKMLDSLGCAGSSPAAPTILKFTMDINYV